MISICCFGLHVRFQAISNVTVASGLCMQIEKSKLEYRCYILAFWVITSRLKLKQMLSFLNLCFVIIDLSQK